MTRHVRWYVARWKVSWKLRAWRSSRNHALGLPSSRLFDATSSSLAWCTNQRHDFSNSIIDLLLIFKTALTSCYAELLSFEPTRTRLLCKLPDYFDDPQAHQIWQKPCLAHYVGRLKSTPFILLCESKKVYFIILLSYAKNLSIRPFLSGTFVLTFNDDVETISQGPICHFSAN
jgi:hypothetical protein